jgi:hypothetical protein
LSLWISSLPGFGRWPTGLDFEIPQYDLIFVPVVLYCCCDTLVLSLDAGAVNPQLPSEVLSSRRGGYTDLLDSHNEPIISVSPAET